MWHAVSTFVDWRAVFNTLLVGAIGLSVWIFKYHYKRAMVAHDLQRKADADWRERVDADINQLREACGFDARDTATRKGNSLDRVADDPPSRGGSGLPDRKR